jgi:hypothetical protein
MSYTGCTRAKGDLILNRSRIVGSWDRRVEKRSAFPHLVAQTPDAGGRIGGMRFAFPPYGLALCYQPGHQPGRRQRKQHSIYNSLTFYLEKLNIEPCTLQHLSQSGWLDPAPVTRCRVFYFRIVNGGGSILPKPLVRRLSTPPRLRAPTKQAVFAV